VEASKRTLGLLLLVLLLFTTPLIAAPPQPKTPEFQPGQVLVKLKPDAPRGLASLLAAGSLSVEDHIPDLDVYVLAVPEGEELAVVEALEKNPAVEYAEPNYLVHAPQPWQRSQEMGTAPSYPMPLPTVEPNDPLYPHYQPCLRIIRAPEAWGITTGSEDPVVAIVSTGATLDHPDLEDKIWINPGEVPGNGIDDDGNGYVDDVHGWDFCTHDYTQDYPYCAIEDNDPTDDNCIKDYYGFGTQLAGVVAAATNNNEGIAGVSWGARIMPVKVFGYDAGGTLAAISQGISYAARNGAKIILMAFWVDDECPRILRDAVNDAYSRGSLLVAPAGNCPFEIRDGHPVCVGNPTAYPAALDPVVAVAATDTSDNLCWFSRYGPYVDVAAPGCTIYSTACPIPYYGRSSTTLAAAHVAGLAALIYSVNPDLPADDVEDIIELSADDVEDPGWDEYTGFGRINAPAALLQTPHRLRVNSTSLGFLVSDEGYISPACQPVTNPNTSHWTWTATSPATWLRVAGPIGDIDSGYTPSRAKVCASWLDLPDTDGDGWPNYGTYTADLALSSTMPFVDPDSSRSVHVVFAYVSEPRRIYLPLISRD